MAVMDFETPAILFSVFGLVLTYYARDIDRWPVRLCAALLSSTVVCTALRLLERAATRYQASASLYQTLLLADVLVTPIPTLLVFAYFLNCCAEDYRKSALMRAMCALTAVLVVLEVVELLSGGTGNLSHVYLLFIAALTAIPLFALLRRRKKLTKVHRVLFLLCFLAPISIQTVLVGLLLSIDLILRYLAQREEESRERMRLAAAQMRPHFIHNTLISLYYLCEKDPEKARRVIRDFTRYLQNNFTAIAEEHPILFKKELEHTRAYLAVEQACNEGRLFVTFDTPSIYFRVPALTLQPVVENAVKHGLAPGLEPLYITVATRDAAEGIRVIVEDTGPGFAPSDDDEPHIALNNIRERLKTMCGGTLEIEPREAGGSRVTIFVPRRDG